MKWWWSRISGKIRATNIWWSPDLIQTSFMANTDRVRVRASLIFLIFPDIFELIILQGLSIFRPIIYGNTATLLTPQERENCPPEHTHKWTVAVRSAASAADSDIVGGADNLGYFIKRVSFKLHDTYANPARSLSRCICCYPFADICFQISINHLLRSQKRGTGFNLSPCTSTDRRFQMGWIRDPNSNKFHSRGRRESHCTISSSQTASMGSRWWTRNPTARCRCKSWAGAFLAVRRNRVQRPISALSYDFD